MKDNLLKKDFFPAGAIKTNQKPLAQRVFEIRASKDDILLKNKEKRAFCISESTFKAKMAFFNLGRQLIIKVFFPVGAIESNQKSVAQMVFEM